MTSSNLTCSTGATNSVGDFKIRNPLEAIEAAKWNTMTYFTFLAFPEKCMFLKPEVTKHAAALTNAELNYKSNLNWLTCSCLLDFAKYLKDELVAMEMRPRDIIDVHLSMWCITPGKHD